jgi:hypothetical protein
VVILDSVIQACLQLVETSAQKAELVTQLIAIWVNIYIDPKYAFTTIHVHGALYKERGFIILGRKKY